MIKKKMKVEGMSCKHCQAKVEKALLMVDGIKNVNVKLETKEVIISMDKFIEDEILNKTVTDIGYKVVSIEEKKSLFGR